MKKHIKLVSVVLAVMLAMSVLTVMSVAVNAAENAENVSEKLSMSTIDTPYDYDIDHIEVVSLPEKNELLEGTIFINLYDSYFNGFEYNVYYTNGVIENYKYGEDDFYDSTDVRIFNSNGEEVYFFDRLTLGEHTVKLYHKLKHSYPHEPIEIAEYNIDVIEDTFISSISSIEIVKKPDKVFTGKFISYDDWNGNPEEYGEYLLENYIPYNMNGAQMQINFNDGTVDVYTFDTSDGLYPIFFYKERQIRVYELGDYKAEVEFAGKTTVFEVNHTGADSTVSDDKKADSTTGNPANGNFASSDTAKSSTSDTATSDSVINGNTDNGAIATGSVMYSVVAIIVLVSACGALAFINRKRYLSK